MAQNYDSSPEIHHANFREWATWQVGAIVKHSFPLNGDQPLSDEDLRVYSPESIRNTGRKVIAGTFALAALVTITVYSGIRDTDPNTCATDPATATYECS